MPSPVPLQSITPPERISSNEMKTKNDRTEMADPFWKQLKEFGIQPNGWNGIQVYCQPRGKKQIAALGRTLIALADNFKEKRGRE